MTFSSHLKKSVLAGTLAAALAISACSPIVDKHGYVPDPERLSSIQIGVDNKESVYQRLGSPSTEFNFGNETWYYISSKQESFAFFAPKTTQRDIVAVIFDKDEYVKDIAGYTVADGKVVKYVGRKTPTRGKELSFLEQMFGNIGRLPAPSQGQGQGQ